MYFSSIMFWFMELYDMGLYHDFSKNYLPNLVIPSNCHFCWNALKWDLMEK